MRQRGTAGAYQRPEILDGDPSDSQLISGISIGTFHHAFWCPLSGGTESGKVGAAQLKSRE
jgi:hypothetical protein